MSAEESKQLVRRLAEEPWQGRLEVIDELVDPGYVGHDPSQPEPLRGPDGLRSFVETYKAAYSDGRITVDEQFAEGDTVTTRWTGQGTNDGELLGIPATGKQVTVTGITVSRLSGGKVVEEHTVWDTFGMLRQLGVVPDMG
jgi:steroid delta-isomerase-like uncharacterized protein